ncbi:MAG: hypothetical protein ACYSUP_18180 [Planctomycetota bacterium]|jgi:hypothetical protein
MAVSLEIIKELVESAVTADIGAVISSPGDLPVDWRIEFEERAAILEYDGGLSRKDADKQALQEILERLNRSG